MLMSQAAMSASVIGLPSCGVSASETPVIVANSSEAEKIARLGVNMPDLPVACHCPTGDRVVVLIGKRQHWGLFRQLAAQGHEFGAARLHIASLVPGAA